MGQRALRELDGIAFLFPALFFFVGLFAGSADELAFNVLAVLGGVGAVGALCGAGFSLRAVMNFADDMGLATGLRYAAMMTLRAGSAFWIWMALVFVILAQVHDHWRVVLGRLAVMSASVAGLVLAIGVGWFVIYAWSKQNVHRPPSG